MPTPPRHPDTRPVCVGRTVPAPGFLPTQGPRLFYPTPDADLVAHPQGTAPGASFASTGRALTAVLSAGHPGCGHPHWAPRPAVASPALPRSRSSSRPPLLNGHPNPHLLLTDPLGFYPPLPSQSSLLAAQSSVTRWVSLAFPMRKPQPQGLLAVLRTPLGRPAQGDARPEHGPWVSSLCATLSQKGGLGVISALLSLRGPWQRSHLDINTHQKRARAHTRSRGSQSPEGRHCQQARTSGGPRDAKECQPRRCKVKCGTYEIKRLRSLRVPWRPIPNAREPSSLWVAKCFAVEGFHSLPLKMAELPPALVFLTPFSP